jgi:hypothetical protein
LQRGQLLLHLLHFFDRLVFGLIFVVHVRLAVIRQQPSCSADKKIDS